MSKTSYLSIVVENDPYIALVGQGVEAFSNALTFYLVNVIPARTFPVSMCKSLLTPLQVRHIPAWFPVTTFQKVAKEGYKLSMAMYHDPFDKAKGKIVRACLKPEHLGENSPGLLAGKWNGEAFNDEQAH